MNVMISLAMVIAITVASIYIVLEVAKPTLDSAELTGDIQDAESFLRSLDNQIEEVWKEGSGSRRIFSFSTDGGYEVSDEDDAIIYQKEARTELVEYQSSVVRDNLIFISGAQASCLDENSQLVMENPYIKAVFRKVPKTSTIRTNETLISMQIKGGSTLSFSNSSVVVDGNATSSYGTGYTELLRTGRNRPFCTVHMAVNSTPFTYDVFYTLYSSSDFIVADVRNIR